ncbi:hypothetical protein [Fastidiosibacter lacustris]|uniref:hypothetical protein n=1 Tax=Fastidiosibacter lacustris TaxID=2056695 RepID=UPI0013008674|nr:hypothetical protein [Fastidiosibacter lacustris]
MSIETPLKAVAAFKAKLAESIPIKKKVTMRDLVHKDNDKKLEIILWCEALVIKNVDNTMIQQNNDVKPRKTYVSSALWETL